MGRAIVGGGGGYNRDSNGAGTGRVSTLRARREEEEAFDTRMGFQRLDLSLHGSETRLGYLFNMLPTTLSSEEENHLDISALDLYLLQQDGSTFKATVAYEPYFYVGVALSALSRTREVISCLERRFEGLISSVTAVEKEDLEMNNHLSGKKREYLVLKFRSVSELNTVKSQLKPVIEKNLQAMRSRDDMLGGGGSDEVSCK
jgi:DNA polymerase epsilon subunit 1